MCYLYVQGHKSRVRIRVRGRVLVCYLDVQGHKIRVRVSVRVRVFELCIGGIADR